MKRSWEFEKISSNETWVSFVSPEILLRKSFSWDITSTLQANISYMILNNWIWDPSSIYLYSKWIQIWWVSLYLRDTENEYRFSYIAMIPELQRKWIMSKFITQVIRPYMKEKYHGYDHVRDNPVWYWIHLWDKVEKIEYEKRRRKFEENQRSD